MVPRQHLCAPSNVQTFSLPRSLLAGALCAICRGGGPDPKAEHRFPRSRTSAYGLGTPAGSVIWATVPWPGSELILITPSYFFTRWPASESPIPMASSREV